MTSNGDNSALHVSAPEADNTAQTTPSDPVTSDPVTSDKPPQTEPVSPTDSAIDQIFDNHADNKENGVQCHPDRVIVSGTGLSGGALGRQFEFNIDARKGGPGELTAFCTGPNRVAYCELIDHENGTFTLRAKPEEVGDHNLQVKYEGEAVNGSPFTFRVAANSQPDASKVRVTGPGVENGVLATYNSTFTVDTLGAGAGNLSVRMQGPRGAFRMEMRRATQGDRKICCHYNPTTTGVYTVIVTWSGDHVPGSPFQVKIFDSEYEMQQEMQNHGS